MATVLISMPRSVRVVDCLFSSCRYARLSTDIQEGIKVDLTTVFSKVGKEVVVKVV